MRRAWRADPAREGRRSYRPRHPEATLHYRLVGRHLDDFVGVYDERFERACGRWRPVVRRVAERGFLTFPDARSAARELFANRKVKTVPFDLDREESDFYHALTDDVEEQSVRASDSGSPQARALGFTMALLQRRFVSSVCAVRRALGRRCEKFAGRTEKSTPARAAIPTSDFDDEALEDLPDDDAQTVVEKIEEVSLPLDGASIRDESSSRRPRSISSTSRRPLRSRSRRRGVSGGSGAGRGAGRASGRTRRVPRRLRDTPFPCARECGSS